MGILDVLAMMAMLGLVGLGIKVVLITRRIDKGPSSAREFPQAGSVCVRSTSCLA